MHILPGTNFLWHLNSDVPDMANKYLLMATGEEIEAPLSARLTPTVIGNINRLTGRRVS
jgi:hypothetical protein